MRQTAFRRSLQTDTLPHGRCHHPPMTATRSEADANRAPRNSACSRITGAKTIGTTTDRRLDPLPENRPRQAEPYILDQR